MICKKSLVLFLFPHRTCFGYLLESPQWGDSDKHPKHLFLEILNTMFLHISDLLSPLGRRFRACQIIIITNIVVVSSIVVKRADCSHKRVNDMRSQTSFYILSIYMTTYNIILIFQLAGAGILGLGIYILGSDYGAKELSSVLGNDLYQIAAYVLIIAGAVLVIISFCGFCGAHRESKLMLGVVSIRIKRSFNLSPMSFWSGLFHFWIWTGPLLEIGVAV